MRRFVLMLLVGTVASLRVAVTGAGGKTGSLCFSKLHALPGTEVSACPETEQAAGARTVPHRHAEPRPVLR